MRVAGTSRYGAGEKVLAIVVGCIDAETIPKTAVARAQRAMHFASCKRVALAALVSASDKLHNVRSVLSDLFTEERKSGAVSKGGVTAPSRIIAY